MTSYESQLEVAACLSGILADDLFAIAGGVAVRLNGFTARSTEDLDMFSSNHQIEIDVVAARAARHLERFGYEVQIDAAATSGMFGRLRVITPAGEFVKVELGRDWREFPSISSEWGPLLDPRDLAVAKLGALWGRREPRDAIDVAGFLDSGRFTAVALEGALAEQDAGFTLDTFETALRAVATYSDDAFARYGVSAFAISSIRDTFQAWADSVAERRSTD